MSDNKYRAIYRDLSQLILGEVVSEDDDKVVLRNAVLLAFGGGESGQVGVQFLPVDLLSMNPPVTIRNFTAEDSFPSTFYKKSLISDDVTVNESIIENYERFLNPSPIVTPDTSVVSPERKPVKLFD